MISDFIPQLPDPTQEYKLFQDKKRNWPHVAHFKSSKTSTEEEMKTLPFHCKTVSTINLEALVKLARGIPQGQRLSQLLKFVDDPTSYTPMSDSEIENAPVTKLSQEDVILYQKAGQIRKISRDQVKATVRQFAVTEERLQKNYGPEVFTNGEQLSQIPNSIKRRHRQCCRHHSHYRSEK
jgi:hypothetical protein